MFSFLRRRTKPKTIPPHMKDFADRFLGPIAMATAVAKVTAEHAERIHKREVPFPVMKAGEVPTLQIWHHLRLEAFMISVRYGEGSLLDLAEIGNQPAALAAFLDQKAHLQFPQPSGDRFAHAVQGMWQAYLYLSEVGREVADPATDPFQVKKREGGILAEIEEGARRSREWWASKNEDPLAATLFTLFFDDMNAKTKSIALSHLLGPYHDKGAEDAITDIGKEHGEELAVEFRKLIELVKRSPNPDQAIEAAAGLEIAEYL